MLTSVHAELQASSAALQHFVTGALGKAVAEIKREVDANQLARIISDNNAWIMTMNDEITSLKGRSDVATVVKALQTVISQLKELKERVDIKSVSAAFEECQGGGLKPADFEPVLRALEERHWEVQQSINESKAEVQQSINEIKAEVLHSICQDKAEVNSGGVLEEMQKLEAKVDHVRSEVDFAPVLQAIRQQSQRKVDVDFSPVLRAIEGSAAKVAGVLSEVQDSRQQSNGKSDVDLAPVLRAVEEAHDKATEVLCEVQTLRQRRVDVDLSPVLRALQEFRNKAGEDMALVTSEMQTIRSRCDPAPILTAIRQNRVEVDFGEVLQVIREKRCSSTELSEAVLQEVRRLRDEAPIASAAAAADAATGSAALAEEAVERQRWRQSKEEQMAEVLAAIREVRDSKPSIDSAEVHNSIHEGLKAPLNDLSEALQALREACSRPPAPPPAAAAAPAAESGGGGSVAEVLQAVRESRPRMDPSEVLAAMRDRDEELLRAIHASGPAAAKELEKQVDKLRTSFNLAPVLEAVDALRSQADHAPILKEIRKLEEAVRSAASSSATPAAGQAQRSPMEDQQCAQAFVELREAVDKAASRDVDLSPLVAMIQEIRVEVSPQEKDRQWTQAFVELKEAVDKVSPQEKDRQWTQAFVELKEAVDKAASREMDLSPLVAAVQEIRVEVDNSEVLAAIRESNAGVRLQGGVNGAPALPMGELSSAAGQTSVMLQELSSLRADVAQLARLDFTPLAAAIRSTLRADIATAGSEEDRHWTQAFVELREAVEKGSVAGAPALPMGEPSSAAGETSVVLQELSDLRADVAQLARLDFAPLAAAIRSTLRADIATACGEDLHKLQLEVSGLRNLDFTPLINAIRERSQEVDFSGVLTEIERVKQDVASLAAELRHNVPRPTLAAGGAAEVLATS